MPFSPLVALMTASANLEWGQSSRGFSIQSNGTRPETGKRHGERRRASAILGLDDLVTAELNTY